MSRTKGAINTRSKSNRKAAELDAEAKKIISFVKRAPKAGRSFADMCRASFDHRKAVEGWSYTFSPVLDRGLISPTIMKRLRLLGVLKCADGRYRV